MDIESDRLPRKRSHEGQALEVKMSKKRWKQPNETLWRFVLGGGFFLMSGGQNFAILLISAAIMLTALWKLRGVDLEEECNSGIHFIDD